MHEKHLRQAVSYSERTASARLQSRQQNKKQFHLIKAINVEGITNGKRIYRS